MAIFAVFPLQKCGRFALLGEVGNDIQKIEFMLIAHGPGRFMATGPTWVLESCVLLCKFDALEIHFEMHIEIHIEMHISRHDVPLEKS